MDRVKDEIVTKGIANVIHDAPISASMVIGKVQFVVPIFGYLLVLFRNPGFLFIMVLIILGIIIYYKTKDILKKSEK